MMPRCLTPDWKLLRILESKQMIENSSCIWNWAFPSLAHFTLLIPSWLVWWKLEKISWRIVINSKSRELRELTQTSRRRLRTIMSIIKETRFLINFPVICRQQGARMEWKKANYQIDFLRLWVLRDDLSFETNCKIPFFAREFILLFFLLNHLEGMFQYCARAARGKKIRIESSSKRIASGTGENICF